MAGPTRVAGVWGQLSRALALLLPAVLLASCGQATVAPTPTPTPASCQALARHRPLGAGRRQPSTPPAALVVRLKPGVPLQQAEELASAAGAEVVKVRRRSRALLARPRPGVGTTGVSNRLASDVRVARVEPDVRVRALEVTPNDPLFREQWALWQIRAPAAWEVTRGLGVKVAVLDTGIAQHPDVAGAAEGYDFVADDPDPTDPGDPNFDCTSHGTMVASIVAAQTNNGRGIAGVTWGASGAQILVARVLDEQGNGSLLDVEEALRWAADRGARVANLSLGTETAAPCPEGLRAAVQEVVARGVLVVAAAGNNGPRSGTVVCPANLDAVVAVGATGPEGTVAYYSSRGPEVDLTAPGGAASGVCSADVRTASPSASDPEDYPCAAGTSFAAPHVSGAAALVLARWPSLDPSEVRAKLERGAEDVGLPGRDPDSGCGMLRADRAVRGETASAPACAPVSR
ncbi:MAG: S8 family serine peptidase [Armatimonadota bacterium]|nr:S8 family serine peptidase [Armatimonadota bacterium]MDW8156359.1 S8 family serine peptidase [Armatimonadota bacterium]